MPLPRKSALIGQIIEAVRLGGWRVKWTSKSHPFDFTMMKGDASIAVRAYIWNITSLDMPEEPDAYRIQLTGVPTKTLRITDGRSTLLLGFERTKRVFSGWHAQTYRRWSSKSPSIFVSEGTLAAARADGMDAQLTRHRTDVVVAFRPEFLNTYVQNLESLHQPSNQSAIEELRRAIRGSDLRSGQSTNPERKRELEAIKRKVRDAKFRSAVIEAYNERCAVCGIQLDLVEAAHIIPVAEDGNDEVPNGISLCPTHHTAFDAALIKIEPSYRIRLNRVILDELRARQVLDGLTIFQTASRLNEELYLPTRNQDRPNRSYLRRRFEG